MALALIEALAHKLTRRIDAACEPDCRQCRL